MQEAIKDAIKKIVDRQSLSRDEARRLMAGIMEGQATDAQIAATLVALRMKGETIEEITGFAETMREKASRVQGRSHSLLDTCGTGGAKVKTFNISTASAIIAAAGGVYVAKHGNRAMSSKCGTADVLEVLGVNIQLSPEQAETCLQETGFCFMLAPLYHKAMKYAVGPRKEVGIRTVFNILGPLTNPAGADHRLLGVFDLELTETMAHVLRELGTKRAMVVAGYDGLDEITINGQTKVTELKDGEVHTFDVSPEDFGIGSASLEEVQGGDAQHNAAIIRNIFDGRPSAARDIVLLNAGASLYVAGAADTLKDGVREAARIIDSGSAKAKLEQLIQVTGEMQHVS
jgi:anthranilate phosphoribosyltransferase